MEKDHAELLPPEVWCQILTLVDDIDDWMALKIVNRLFYEELSTRGPLSLVDSAIKISEEVLNCFKTRPKKRNFPRDMLVNAVGPKRNSIPFRVVFLGPTGTGRTTFLRRFITGDFDMSVEPTIGASFFTKGFADPDGIVSKMEIWDTSGLERMASLNLMYIRGAEAMFLTFRIDRRDTFVDVVNRIVLQVYNCLQNYLQLEHRPVIYLLGLQSDLERKVPYNEAKTIARMLGIKYFECSAKLNKNVSEVMEEMKEDLLQRWMSERRLSLETRSIPMETTVTNRRCLVM